MRVAHFTPSYKPICDGQTAQLLREHDSLNRRVEGYEYMWWSLELSDIARVRNLALQQAIDWECDFLVMQDSDVYSKASIGAIPLLLETAASSDATIVAAIVGLRREPHTANVEPCNPGQVYKAEKCGTGLVCIDVNQVKAWNYDGPWFKFIYNQRGTECEVGEDIFFSQLVTEMGGSIWVDGRVPTTHVCKDTKSLDYPGANASVTRDSSLGAQNQG